MSALPPIATSIAVFRISALGQKRTFAPQQVMSTSPPKADIEAGPGFKLVQSANLTYVFRCERVRCRALLRQSGHETGRPTNNRRKYAQARDCFMGFHSSLDCCFDCAS